MRVFDMNQDPQAKERLLSGQYNVAACPNCGYQGMLAIPVVYHDPEKELLLTYVPPEMGLPLEGQQSLLAPLMQEIVDKLPAEKRKAYLFQPKAMLSYDTLIEKVLEADGITKEMIQNQQNQINLIRNLFAASEDSIPTMIQQNIKLIDSTFFSVFSGLMQQAAETGDQASLKKLQAIQKVLLNETETGKQLKIRAQSTQKAIKDLQDLGENLNQDSLLNLVLNSPDDAYLQTLAGIARNGMDYEFFTKFTSAINSAENDEKKKHYTELRDKLLDLTKKIDEAIKKELQDRRNVLENILKENDIQKAIIANAEAIDDSFLSVANEELAKARKSSDFMRSGKIQNIIDTIHTMSKTPDEVDFIQKLLACKDEEEIKKALDDNPTKVTDDFKKMIQLLNSEAPKSAEMPQEMKDKLIFIQKTLGL